MRILWFSLWFLVAIAPVQAQFSMVVQGPSTSAPTSEEVQILGTQIGVGLSDTGTAAPLNLGLSTQLFNTVDWLATGGTSADNIAVAPDGTTTSASFTEANLVGGTHGVTQGYSKATSALTYTFSISAKSGLRTRIALQASDSTGTNGVIAVFDLFTPQIGQAAVAFGSGWTAGTATISSQSNGNLLCKMTFTTDATAWFQVTAEGDNGTLTGARSTSYTGSNALVAYDLWGANVNTGSSVQTYGNVTNSGVAATALNDNNLTTFWGTQTTAAWAGVDAGSAVQWTRYRFAPRPGNTGPALTIGLDYEALMQGELIQTSSSATFASGNTTLDTIPATPFYPRFQLSERSLAGSPARYIRLLPGSSAYGSVSELQFFGTVIPGSVNAAPIAPVISPWGGRFSSGATTVTLSSSTAGASIYYTTDGSTPTNSHGTLYNGPFTYTIGATTGTLKAVSYEAALSTPLSAVQSAVFYPTGLTPNSNMYDACGVLIEAHGGGMTWDAGTGKYYWFGEALNKVTVTNLTAAGPDPRITSGVMMYSSADLENWDCGKNILPMPAGNSSESLPWRYIERISAIFNVTSSKWVLWAHISDGNYNATDRAVTATASSLAGPWTWTGSFLDTNGVGVLDTTTFLDDDGSGYFLNTVATGTYINKLAAADFLSVTSTTFLSGGNAGGPAMFKSAGTYFLIHSGPNFYDSSSAMNETYITSTAANPMSGWAALPGSALFQTDPTGTNFNAQSAWVTIPQGTSYPLLGADFYVKTDLYASRYTFIPLNITSATTIQARTPVVWDVTPAAFKGDGDIVSGAMFYGGLVAYTAAQATAGTQPLVNARRVSDGHTCDLLVVASGFLGNTANCSTGGDNGQSASSFKGASTIFAHKIYNTSGGSCGDATAATTGQEAQIVLNGGVIPSRPTMTFVGASNQFYTATCPNQAQPYSTIVVMQSQDTSSGHPTYASSPNFFLFINGFAGPFDTYAGNTLAGAGHDNFWHTWEGVFAGASSFNTMDGLDSSGNAGTAATGTSFYIGGDNVSSADSITGNISATGLWPVGHTAAQRGALCRNEFLNWSLPTGC